MSCPVKISDLLADHEDPGAVTVRLTPFGGVAVIKAANAKDPALAAWVAERIGPATSGHLPFHTFSGVAQKLGLEQREALIVMAAIHVADPTRFKLIDMPPGMPANPEGFEQVIKEAFMKSGLAQQFPLLEIVP